MSTEHMTVLAKARPGMLDEFERWYDEVHIPEILDRYAEVVSVVRYRLHPAVNHGDAGVHDSVAVYEVRGSAAELWRRLLADTSMTVGTAFDYKRARALFSRV